MGRMMIKTWSIYSGIWLAEKMDPMGNIFGVRS
jgi:predicted enzyme related to lactoylglutathione lyase